MNSRRPPNNCAATHWPSGRPAWRLWTARGLLRSNVGVEDDTLRIADEEMPLRDIRRIVVVGAGKAGAGMAAGLEAALGDQLMADKQLTGWVNVPADCVRPLRRIHSARRPARRRQRADGRGRGGRRQILRAGRTAEPDDLCLCLISGGGSALLPAPVDGHHAGTTSWPSPNISAEPGRISSSSIRSANNSAGSKGGGLARACRAGRLVSLIISDVLGDPLDVIASGPTVDDTTTPRDALDVLEQFDGARGGNLRRRVRLSPCTCRDVRHRPSSRTACRVTNYVIGNNAVAVDAAGMEAERRGYSHAMVAARQLEGEAEGRPPSGRDGRTHAQPPARTA